MIRHLGDQSMKFWNNPYSKWVLLVTIAILLLFDFYNIDVFTTRSIHPKVFGTVGSWVGSILTALAVLIAAEGLRSDRLKTERAALEKQRMELNRIMKEDQARADATKQEVGRIFAWLSVRQDAITNTIESAELNVVNQTELPVYQWNVIFEGESDSRWGAKSLGPVVPGRHRYSIDDRLLVAKMEEGSVPRVTIEFEASNGEKLVRDYGGSLQ